MLIGSTDSYKIPTCHQLSSRYDTEALKNPGITLMSLISFDLIIGPKFWVFWEETSLIVSSNLSLGSKLFKKEVRFYPGRHPILVKGS